MPFIHCHDCGWSQDDFYDENGYNPAEYLKGWNNFLCGHDDLRLDQIFTDDADFLREHGPITTREVIAREYERFAKRIRTMRWITREKWEEDQNKICPSCGSHNLDID